MVLELTGKDTRQSVGLLLGIPEKPVERGKGQKVCLVRSKPSMKIFEFLSAMGKGQEANKCLASPKG